MVGLSHNVGIPDGGVKTSPAIKPTINHQQKHRTPEINGEGPNITTQVHTRTTLATVPKIHWARLQIEIVCIDLYGKAIHAIKQHQATRARYGKSKIPRILKISKEEKISFRNSKERIAQYVVEKRLGWVPQNFWILLV